MTTGVKYISPFRNDAGELIRPFASVEEMDELMVARWNAVVRPQDHVYHLGDVAMQRKHLEIVKRLHGHKRLVRGNHDIFRTREYLDVGFKEIHGMRVLDNMILTHAPVHPSCIGRRFRGNVHGHTHERRMIEMRYLNVCVEQIAYTPISLEDARARLEAEPQFL